MLSIKFSHDYPKLWGQRIVKLIGIRFIDKKDLNPTLLKYDTTFFDKDGNSHQFPLKGSNFLQLIFIGEFGVPFCTIRSAYPQSKIEYYQRSIGQKFLVVIEG